MTNDQPTTEETIEENPLLVRGRQQFMLLATMSDELRANMLSATTSTKAKYYHRKLKKNNAKAIRLLSSMDRFEQMKAMSNEANQSTELPADDASK